LEKEKGNQRAGDTNEQPTKKSPRTKNRTEATGFRLDNEGFHLLASASQLAVMTGSISDSQVPLSRSSDAGVIGISCIS
jgi:hypothetical protein